MNKVEKEIEFADIFLSLKNCGKVCRPRGLKIIEIENFGYTLSPYNRFCNFKSRKLNLDYIKNEFKWYLKGDKYDTSICEHASMWRSLINEDGSIASNYGQYIFANNAFYRVARELLKDHDSRRACINILSFLHFNELAKELPCTYYINFRIRENKLNMTVGMRSQDAAFGMGNDAPAFSFIHEMMFMYLKEFIPKLEYGIYYHHADSFHIYEKHFEMLDKIVGGDEYKEIECPKISCKDEVDFLIKHDFSNIPERFEFAKWLSK